MKSKPKKRGPARNNSPGTLVGLRCHAPFLHAVDGWREREDDKLSRPAAIVRLAELGLAMSGSRGRGISAKTASKAAALAGQEIDRLADQSAPVEERDRRKRRLLKGPKEFRDMRDDHR